MSSSPTVSPVRRIAGRALLAIGTPLVLAAYAAWPTLGILPCVALVPWALLYADDRFPRASAWWIPPAAWLGWMLQHPQVQKFGWFVAPIMGAVFVWVWFVFPWLLRSVRAATRWPMTFALPVAWVAFEWLRVQLTLAHFDLYLVGYSVARATALSQVADVTGVYGLSFLVAMLNGLIADAVLAKRAAREAPGAQQRRTLGRQAAAVAAILVVVAVYGAVRLRTIAAADGPKLAVVQPNIEHNERNAVGVHLAEVVFTEERVPPGSADLIVWPENAVLDNVARPGMYLVDLGRLAKEKGAPMLVGAMRKVKDDPGRTSNAAVLVDASGSIVGESTKQILFPWSERIPADDLLRAVAPPLWRLQRRLVRIGWGFVPTGVPGTRTPLLHLPWNGATLPFAVFICVENTTPRLAAQAALDGARFFVTITSEREVGGSIQEQILRISMMRAVENRRAYVRCGNSGISAFIDPAGRAYAVLRGDHGGTIFDSGVLAAAVPLSTSGPTLYARSHDAFALACLALAVAGGLAARLRGRPAATATAAAAALLFGSAGCAGALPGSLAPEDAARRVDEGSRRLEQGDPAGAIAPLTAACGDAAACRRAIPLLGRAYRESRRFEEGAEALGRLAETSSVRAAALAERSALFDRLSELRPAERAAAESARLDPVPETLTALGTLRLRLEDPQGALAAYGEALARAPADPQVRYLHARALWLTGHPDAARPELDALLAEHPEMGAAWAVLGRLRDAAQDPAGAAEAYRSAIRADPENVEARFLLARQAIAAGDLVTAKGFLAEIWRIDGARGPRRASPAETP